MQISTIYLLSTTCYFSSMAMAHLSTNPSPYIQPDFLSPPLPDSPLLLQQKFQWSCAFTDSCIVYQTLVWAVHQSDIWLYSQQGFQILHIWVDCRTVKRSYLLKEWVVQLCLTSTSTRKLKYEDIKHKKYCFPSDSM